MKIKLIEKIRFKLSGRAVPVIRVSDIEDDGRINTLELVGEIKRRQNSLLETWNAKGDEIRTGQKMITIVDEKGVSVRAFAISKGVTCDLYTTPRKYPDVEDIIGKAATMDDIADSMDLQKSMKYLAMGILFGMPVWWIVFTVISEMLK